LFYWDKFPLKPKKIHQKPKFSASAPPIWIVLPGIYFIDIPRISIVIYNERLLCRLWRHTHRGRSYVALWAPYGAAFFARLLRHFFVSSDLTIALWAFSPTGRET
jgi:hypothetical protein